MKTTRSEAVVLVVKDYGESDRLITFYTRAKGRLRGIAKGARRSRKRFAHVFEPCSLVELTYRERNSLLWIEGCKLLESYLPLRTEIERWGSGALVCEVMLEMVPEGEHQPELFLLLTETLYRLSEDRDSLNVVLLFLFRFLDMMGYLPALESCKICQRPLTQAIRWWWCMNEGVLLCPEHRTTSEDVIKLDLGTLILIQHSRRLPLERVWRLRFLQEKKSLLLHGLTGWIRAHIRKELKSLRMLEQVQSA